jgi:hypothetical protein
MSHVALLIDRSVEATNPRFKSNRPGPDARTYEQHPRSLSIKSGCSNDDDLLKSDSDFEAQFLSQAVSQDIVIASSEGIVETPLDDSIFDSSVPLPRQSMRALLQSRTDLLHQMRISVESALESDVPAQNSTSLRVSHVLASSPVVTDSTSPRVVVCSGDAVLAPWSDSVGPDFDSG